MADTKKSLVATDAFSDIKTIIAEAEGDMEKFGIQGNAAAGTRLRKAMLAIKEKAQIIRVDVQKSKNNAKVKATK